MDDRLDFCHCAFGLCAVVVGILQWSAMRGQLDEMRKQIELTDRPWIEIVSATATDGMSFYATANGKAGIHMGIKLRVKNVGRAAAVDITLKSRLVLRTDSMQDTILRQQRLICLEPPQYSIGTFTLFPEMDSGTRLFRDYYQTIPEEAFLPTMHPEKWVSPVITGCISYKTTVSGTTHHTGFMYEFGTTTNRSTDTTLFRVDRNVPAAELVMVEEPFGFSDAT